MDQSERAVGLRHPPERRKIVPRQFEGKHAGALRGGIGALRSKRPLTPDQRLWYRRSFTASQAKGTRLLLHFGAVDWRAEVFVNGKAVGQHEGGYDAFTFDITDALRPGADQELVVAVWDPTDSGACNRAASRCSNPNGIWYTAVSGIWQTVWLEPVPAAHIREIAMTPDIDAHELRLTVAAADSADLRRRRGCTARWSDVSRGRPIRTTVKLALSQMELWSPDSPTLYDLDITLKSGDSVKSYFGMRSVEPRADAAGVNRIFLNHKPLFQIGPLDQGWWPDGLYTAPTDEALRSSTSRR